LSELFNQVHEMICDGASSTPDPVRHRAGWQPFDDCNLPTPGTKRWVIRRKAEVVAAVRGGLLSLEEACSRYTLAVDEFLSWQHSIDQHGLAGLRSTRTQQYRQK